MQYSVVELPKTRWKRSSANIGERNFTNLRKRDRTMSSDRNCQGCGFSMRRKTEFGENRYGLCNRQKQKTTCSLPWGKSKEAAFSWEGKDLQNGTFHNHFNAYSRRRCYALRIENRSWQSTYWDRNHPGRQSPLDGANRTSKRHTKTAWEAIGI